MIARFYLLTITIAGETAHGIAFESEGHPRLRSAVHVGAFRRPAPDAPMASVQRSS